MAKQITLEMVTPEKVAWSAPADFVVLPALGGEMGVLPGHATFVVQLAAGEVRVTTGADVKRFAVSGGFAEVKDDKVALFAETAEMSDQIDVEAARQALEKSRAAAVKPGLDPLTLAAVEAQIRADQVRIRVAKRRTPPPHMPGGSTPEAH